MGWKHIDDRFDFRGTYGAIAATKDRIEPMVCDVEIDEWSQSGMKETRAFRQELKLKGKKVPTLRSDTLHDELFVIVGPQMSVASAVKRCLARSRSSSSI